MIDCVIFGKGLVYCGHKNVNVGVFVVKVMFAEKYSCGGLLVTK